MTNYNAEVTWYDKKEKQIKFLFGEGTNFCALHEWATGLCEELEEQSEKYDNIMYAITPDDIWESYRNHREEEEEKIEKAEKIE